MQNGICGTNCTLTFPNSAINIVGHQWNLSLDATEFDTRAFGDGIFGDWTMCARSGSLTIQAYNAQNIDIGDSGTCIASVSTQYLVIPYIVKGITFAADAKGMLEYNLTSRVTGNITYTTTLSAMSAYL